MASAYPNLTVPPEPYAVQVQPYRWRITLQVSGNIEGAAEPPKRRVMGQGKAWRVSNDRWVQRQREVHADHWLASGRPGVNRLNQPSP